MTAVKEFAAGYSFSLDPFQIEACEGLAAGRSALVCAPTGAGKTVVGEFAVWLALREGRKAFYTTPLKALSNQKFGDFIARYGAAQVGLLTGDNSINGEAPIVVMTTEVLRNMLYEGSPTLQGLGFVVMDEVHYLQDAYRGAVWEEVLIHLPASVRVAALSATVSNAEEFGEWLRTVRGGVDVVIEERRPVPLDHHYMVGDTVHPMFVGERPNPALKKMSLNAERRRRGREHMRARRAVPRREDVIAELDDRGMLPAIYFIFSRAGCDQAVRYVVGAQARLTTPEEAERIAEYVELRAEVLPQDDLEVLGYSEWREGLVRGVAAHHAGLIPLFKETVEELFERGLVKAVFATETLSLGINMPAKTVAIEKLVKFTGERHEMMTPGEYTQLTGRAGRRGIDPLGHAVVLFQPDVPFERVASLVGARTYPLSSSFRPSYNMAVNLLRIHDLPDALSLVERSFAQFLADRSATGLTSQVARTQKFLSGYRERADCDRGDFAEYWALRRKAKEQELEAADNGPSGRRGELALARLRVGDVVRLGGRGRGLLAVVAGKRGGVPLALTASDKLQRLTARDVTAKPLILGRIELPRRYPWKHQIRRQVLAQLTAFKPAATVDEPEPADAPAGEPDSGIWAEISAHPVHRCPDRAEHERWMARAEALEKDLATQQRRLRTRTEGLARVFERVISVLTQTGYVDDAGNPTSKGDALCRIYNEGDLLVAESLQRGILDGLTSIADLAAVVSVFVFSPRGGLSVEPAWPNEDVRQGYVAVRRLWREIEGLEEANGLSLSREPEPGFTDAIHAWTDGEPLEEVLAFAEMSAGDFVRSAKQVWDLLRQLVEVAPSDEFASRCRKAAGAVYRGVVAYSGAI